MFFYDFENDYKNKTFYVNAILFYSVKNSKAIDDNIWFEVIITNYALYYIDFIKRIFITYRYKKSYLNEINVFKYFPLSCLNII